ncbi:DUF2892 domain-containing protein [Acetobacter estunensis]|uniref:YgaP family membrane protein n=1 Tax=Acetobacter estunensis TaxID=104097 RepID=UPI001C2D7DF7|nr:DUF2892 domain-containing protein [Acetobacter estunensis]MBV1838678.1 DUF2892 domain-containing protein [Acetobacter estunensis]
MNPPPREIMPIAENDAHTEWERYKHRLLAHLPRWSTRPLFWLMAEEHRLVRLITGILMLLGGLFSFLPILGLWMAPVGIVLLAEDIPFFRAIGLKGMRWLERRKPDLFRE